MLKGKKKHERSAVESQHSNINNGVCVRSYQFKAHLGTLMLNKTQKNAKTSGVNITKEKMYQISDTSDKPGRNQQILCGEGLADLYKRYFAHVLPVALPKSSQWALMGNAVTPTP